MVAAGYRLRFKNSGSVLHAMADSYGSAVVALERELLRDVRLTASLRATLAAGAARRAMEQPEQGHEREGNEGIARLGVHVSIGDAAPAPAPQSPCMLTRDIFGPA
jgi:hypothetical protein